MPDGQAFLVDGAAAGCSACSYRIVLQFVILPKSGDVIYPGELLLARQRGGAARCRHLYDNQTPAALSEIAIPPKRSSTCR